MVYKPFRKDQIDLIEGITHEIHSWINTNDTTSPTHSSDIMEELRKYDLDKNTFENLQFCIWNLFKTIRDLPELHEDTV